jgi:ADP-ribose pyrophosphatase YjhB (NUDIX family)
MHWIQRDILKKLSTSKERRYIELKPETVDGNLFMYHLKLLIKEGLVAKNEKAYELTANGKRQVADLSLATGTPTKTPRLFTMLYAENKKGELLLYEWSRQPYLGHISLPFSRIRYGESVFEAAKNNIKSKTSFISNPQLIGNVSVIVKNGEEVTTHYLAQISKVGEFDGEPNADGLTGKPFWGNIDEYNGGELVYGTKEIIELVKTKKSPFFEEIIVDKDQSDLFA